MPFNGSGAFIPLSLPDFPAIGGQPIYATQFNNVINDLLGGFTSVLTRDGQSSLTGNLAFAGNRATNMASAIAVGQPLIWGQGAGFLGDLTVQEGIQAKRASFVEPAGVDSSLYVGVTGVAAVRFGYNATAGLSQVSTPAGAAYIGSPQNVDLHVGLAGAVAATFKANGDFTIPGTFRTSIQEGARYSNSDTFLTFYNTPLTLRTGYIRAIAGSAMQVAAEGSVALQFVVNGATRLGIDTVGNTTIYGALTVTANAVITGGVTANVTGNVSGSAGSVPWTGVSGRPTALSQFTNDLSTTFVSSFNGRLNAVTLSSLDVTNALGFTPISGITGAQVNAALGYAPYNGVANPFAFINGISSSMVNVAMGFTVPSRASFSAAKTVVIGGINGGNGSKLNDISFTYNATTGVFTLQENRTYYASTPPDGGA